MNNTQEQRFVSLSAEKVNKMIMKSEFHDGFNQGSQKEKIEIANKFLVKWY